MIYYEINDFEKALARINEAIHLNRNEAGYYMMRGVIRYQTDDLEGTMKDLIKLLSWSLKTLLLMLTEEYSE